MCLVNRNLADIPVIVAAIDPCLSCTCRMVVVQKNGTNCPAGSNGRIAGDPGERREGEGP
jgi:hypothetical protein